MTSFFEEINDVEEVEDPSSSTDLDPRNPTGNKFLEGKFGNTVGPSGGNYSGGAVVDDDLLDNINKQILAELRGVADIMGQNGYLFEHVFETNVGSFWQDAFTKFLPSPDEPPPGTDPELWARNVGGDYQTAQIQSIFNTPHGYNQMLEYARMWWGSRFGPEVAQVWSTAGSGSGRRGGGSRGPTAADIRKQFDVNELAGRVNDLYRGYVLDEATDPRGIAKAYVDKVVASRGEQKIDFDTFVLSNYIKGSARYAAIYKNKPEGISETDYMSQYIQQAAQVIRPQGVNDTAIAGAQFGASAEQFNERLMRSNEFRTSSPFMQRVEGRLQDIKGVLKG